MHEKDLKMGLLCDFYGKLLTPKQYEAIVMYYDDDLSLSEIADTWGITRQGVRDCLKKGEAQLNEMEEKLGLCAKFQALNEAMEQIKEAAAQIGAQNSRGMINAVIADKVQVILRAAEQMSEDGI